MAQVPPYQTPPPAYDKVIEIQPRRSGCGRVAIVLLVVGFLGLLLCCGGALIGFFQSTTTSPERVAAIRSEIVEIDVDDFWRPQMGMKFLPFGWTFWRMVVYNDRDDDAALVLIALSFGADPEQMRTHMESQIRQNLRTDDDIRIEEREERTFTIRGQEVTFEFARGTNRNDVEMIQVMGVFLGPSGPSMLIIIAPEARYNFDDAQRLIESMR